ncbi:hypothetical protein D3C87_1877320 [compost metagenome]
MDVGVHLLFRAVVQPQDGNAVVEQPRVQAAQLGQIERKCWAVVQTQQKTGDDSALAGIALSDGHQAQQGINAYCANGRAFCPALKQLIKKLSCSGIGHGASP